MESEPRRALICEDDPAIRPMMAKILQLEGFLVDTAADGMEAIEKIDAGRYQLIVVDLIMPKMNGYEVVKYLKDHLPPSLKRIVVTTADTEALRTQFPEDICKVLAKPFEMTDFITYAKECSEDTSTR